MAEIDGYDQAIADAEAALADLKAKREEARKPKIPDEPRGWGIVIRQDGKVPAIRTSRSTWSYITLLDHRYTWEELMEQGSHDFEILYKN